MTRAPDPSATTRGLPSNRGFTLLEMLVVLAILGLIGGLVFPVVERQIVGASFRATAVEIELAVRRAQADALRENRTVRVEPMNDTNGRGRQNLVRREHVSMVIDEPAPILFYRDGSSNGGTRALTVGARTFRVLVNPQTGVVTSALQ